MVLHLKGKVIKGERGRAGGVTWVSESWGAAGRRKDRGSGGSEGAARGLRTVGCGGHRGRGEREFSATALSMALWAEGETPKE